MTYFMMGGRYDQVSKGFSSNNFGFHALMIVSFFFTVILMLNVLIALINHAFDDGDKTWELEWLQNRMRYVERAENLICDTPGFRAAHNFFPETIYYTATPLQVRDYRNKTRKIIEEKAAVDSTIAADTPTQAATFGSDGGSGRQDRQQESVNANAGNEALMALLKQFHEEQQQARDEQRRAYEEQKQAHEELRSAHEEQRRTAAELQRELTLLKQQFGQ
ncbi:hypothetical protein BGX29_001644 [Mortierella sp. GBA35]|nr:hypothetical protein BGX29_001644 [Mortierella sp. GBA35]